MWKRLRDCYAFSSVLINVQLQTKLSNLQYHGQAMVDYITSFEEMLNRLEGRRGIIEEDMGRYAHSVILGQVKVSIWICSVISTSVGQSELE